jgi:hypothetical protein
MFTLQLPWPADSSLILTPPWPGLPPGLRIVILVLLVLVPFGMMAWLYLMELAIIPRITAGFLFCLRLAVLTLLLCLICLQPVYARDRHLDLPGRVLIAIDRSESMNITDPQREPAEKLRLARALHLAPDLVKDPEMDNWINTCNGDREPQVEPDRHPVYQQVIARVDALTRSSVAGRVLTGEGIRLLEQLQKRGHTVEILGFHRESWEIPSEEIGKVLNPSEGEAKPDDKTSAAAFTDLRLPLLRALEQSAPGRGKVLGVVLLSDGQHNYKEPPSAKARELGERGVPIYPVALGAKKSPADVAVVSLRGPNHTLFKGVEANIEVTFKVSGLREQDFIVSLHRTGQGDHVEKKLVAERTIHHDGTDREYKEQFSVPMDEVGTQTLEAIVRPVNPTEKETRTDNNRLVTTVSVADDRARVLLIDGEARWELHYLQTALNRDRSLEVVSVVYNQPRLEENLSPEDVERLGLPRQQLPTGMEAVVRFRLAGMKAQDVIVELFGTPVGTKAKKLLGQKTIRHEGVDRDYTETFPVKMEELGAATPEVVVRRVSGDGKNDKLDNNTLGTAVSVADSLSSYQCIIVGDVSPENFSLAERARLERYVADAGGTVVILAGKRAMPLGFPEMATGGELDPLRKLLPIEAPRALRPGNGFPLRLTNAGREMAFMNLVPDDLEENNDLWTGRPREWGWGVAGRAKPGAVTLAYTPDEVGQPEVAVKPADRAKVAAERERNSAVVVRQSYGFGRVVFVGLDSTWRWRYKVGDLYHHRFWGQAIRWAASDKPLVVGNPFVRFGTPQPVYQAGQDVEIVSRLNDLLGPLKPTLLAGARIVRLPDAPGGKETSAALVPLAMRPAQPRVLDGSVRDLPPGQYAIELNIPDYADKLTAPSRDGGEMKPLRAGFTVAPPQSRELIDLGTNWTLLDELAVKSGGKLFVPETAGELADLLVKKSIPIAEHHEQRVYRWWVFLVLVVCLMTVEWVMRKWAGLP